MKNPRNVNRRIKGAKKDPTISADKILQTT